MTLLLALALSPLITLSVVFGGLWLWGYIDSLTATCPCGAFLHKGRCTHPINHQPVADWARPTTVSVSYLKPEPLALPRGDR